MCREKVFNRLSIKDRGHFSNYFTFSPVSKLKFGEYKLEITQRQKIVEVPYDQLKARVLKRYIKKSYGTYAGGVIKQTLVELLSPRVKFKFDLSAQFPDFKDGSEILSLIQEKMEVIIVEESLKLYKQKQRDRFIAVIILIVIIFLLYIILK